MSPNIPVEERFWAKVEKREGGCWEWKAATTEGGYGYFRFNGRPQNANRVAWILTKGPIPDGIFVCHRCDNRKCVNPDHLFLGTNQNNLDDMKEKGRSSRGEKNTMHRYTEATIYRVKQMKVQGYTREKTAKETGVSQSTISMIWNEKTWKHISVPGFTSEDGRSLRWRRIRTGSDG